MSPNSPNLHFRSSTLRGGGFGFAKGGAIFFKKGGAAAQISIYSGDASEGTYSMDKLLTMQIETQETAVEVQSLTKTYGNVVALRDVSLSIPRGQATAVIGQNGAGKTTLLEIMVNLRKPDRGSVRLLGLDVARNPGIVSKVGIQLQEASMFPMVTVGRYLALFSKLYGVPAPPEELLYRLGLNNHLNKKFVNLSGGLKQRTLLAVALLNDPEILMLDEPSTGLDPLAREVLWEFIETWIKDRRRTLILTSHYMEEVERLCERVVVLADSRIVEDDLIEALLERVPGSGNSLQSAYGKLVRETSCCGH